MQQRVVITGMGIWSCIGEDVKAVEQSLRLGRSGIGADPRRTEYGYQSPLTGIVPVPDLSHEGLRRSQRMCLSEAGRYAYMAMKQALEQAPITDRHRVGLIVSNDSTACELAEVEDIMRLHHDSRRLGAGAVFRSLNSTVSMALASIFGIGGISLTVSAACAGGGHAVGLALSLIRSGHAQMLYNDADFDAILPCAQRTIPFGCQQTKTSADEIPPATQPLSETQSRILSLVKAQTGMTRMKLRSSLSQADDFDVAILELELAGIIAVRGGVYTTNYM